MGASDATPRIWFKDFAYYASWFLIFGGLFSFLQFVTPEQMAGWAVKVKQAMLGVGFGNLRDSIHYPARGAKGEKFV